MVLKDWEKNMREYHAAGGPEYTTDEVKNMLLRKILPMDDKKRLTHREFVDGAHGTVGESYEQLRQRVLDTVTREELEVQARDGKMLMTEDVGEQVYKNTEAGGDDERDQEPMEEEEVQSIFAAIDSGVLTEEQINTLQRRVQRKGRCFNCGRPGHFAKDCRSAKRRPGKGTGKGAGYNPAAGKECRACHEIGHFARDCPKSTGGGGV